jgi:hypothetical protein
MAAAPTDSGGSTGENQAAAAGLGRCRWQWDSDGAVGILAVAEGARPPAGDEAACLRASDEAAPTWLPGRKKYFFCFGMRVLHVIGMKGNLELYQTFFRI